MEQLAASLRGVLLAPPQLQESTSDTAVVFALVMQRLPLRDQYSLLKVSKATAAVGPAAWAPAAARAVAGLPLPAPWREVEHGRDLIVRDLPPWLPDAPGLCWAPPPEAAASMPAPAPLPLPAGHGDASRVCPGAMSAILAVQRMIVERAAKYMAGRTPAQLRAQPRWELTSLVAKVFPLAVDAPLALDSLTRFLGAQELCIHTGSAAVSNQTLVDDAVRCRDLQQARAAGVAPGGGTICLTRMNQQPWELEVPLALFLCPSFQALFGGRMRLLAVREVDLGVLLADRRLAELGFGDEPLTGAAHVRYVEPHTLRPLPPGAADITYLTGSTRAAAELLSGSSCGRGSVGAKGELPVKYRECVMPADCAAMGNAFWTPVHMQTPPAANALLAPGAPPEAFPGAVPGGGRGAMTAAGERATRGNPHQAGMRPQHGALPSFIAAAFTAAMGGDAAALLRGVRSTGAARVWAAGWIYGTARQAAADAGCPAAAAELADDPFAFRAPAAAQLQADGGGAAWLGVRMLLRYWWRMEHVPDSVQLAYSCTGATAAAMKALAGAGVFAAQQRGGAGCYSVTRSAAEQALPPPALVLDNHPVVDAGGGDMTILATLCDQLFAGVAPKWRKLRPLAIDVTLVCQLEGGDIVRIGPALTKVTSKHAKYYISNCADLYRCAVFACSGAQLEALGWRLPADPVVSRSKRDMRLRVEWHMRASGLAAGAPAGLSQAHLAAAKAGADAARLSESAAALLAQQAQQAAPLAPPLQHEPAIGGNASALIAEAQQLYGFLALLA